ncbi:MAG: hypothetical protein Q7U01_02965, partial [Pseudomonas sp.]|nr:hypothetical protein [Pseudomonas sp.]
SAAKPATEKSASDATDKDQAKQPTEPAKAQNPADQQSSAKPAEQPGKAQAAAQEKSAKQADSQDPEGTPAKPLDTEQRQALEQWLRQIPDEPGELLRRKFWYEQQQRQEQSR